MLFQRYTITFIFPILKVNFTEKKGTKKEEIKKELNFC